MTSTEDKTVTDGQAGAQIADVLEGICLRYVTAGLPENVVITALLGAALRVVCARCGPADAVVWLREAADLIERDAADPSAAARMSGCEGSA